jgi:ribonuclease HI
MSDVRIWTDGACLRNPGGEGGWAFIVETCGDAVLAEDSGYERETTSQRMELTALIHALRWAGKRRVEIHSDSKYAVEGSMVWMQRWKQHGWTRKGRNGKRPAPENLDLWRIIDQLLQGSLVTIHWVKGHDGSRFNEMADKLATQAARRA